MCFTSRICYPVLTYAIPQEYFQSLFTLGFSESKSKLWGRHTEVDVIDIGLDDPNITRAGESPVSVWLSWRDIVGCGWVHSLGLCASYACSGVMSTSTVSYLVTQSKPGLVRKKAWAGIALLDQPRCQQYADPYS